MIPARRRRRQVVRQRSAKPPSPVQIRAAPPFFSTTYGPRTTRPFRCAHRPMCPHEVAVERGPTLVTELEVARPRHSSCPRVALVHTACGEQRDADCSRAPIAPLGGRQYPVGSAVDRTDWKGYILPLLFFKRICDVWDEETAEAVETYGDADPSQFPEVHRFQCPRAATGGMSARRPPTSAPTLLMRAHCSPRTSREDPRREGHHPGAQRDVYSGRRVDLRGGSTPTRSTASSGPPTGATARSSPTSCSRT